jgi:serine/threonine-protein kinase HipA
MRRAKVYMHKEEAGMLIEVEMKKQYRFMYTDSYQGESISVTMPVKEKVFRYDYLPPFFEGLLPEGANLEALLRSKKIDRDDHFSQLIEVGKDTVGAVTVEEVEE